MDVFLIIYFLAGIIQDFLVTLNWRYVSTDKVVPAVTFSFLATIVSFTVLYDIVTKLDPKNSLLAIVTYSLGVGVGTLLGMKFKPGFKK